MSNSGMIIACIPVDKEEQERLKCSPTKGKVYNLSKCDRCNEEILISQKQEKISADTGCPVWCARCVYGAAKNDSRFECVNLKDFH